MIEFAISFFAVLVVVPLTALLIKWKLANGVLSRAGIKGPSPTLYYGNGKEINELGHMEFLNMNFQKYGDIFGYYIGPHRYIAVKDLEMIKQIMVKQFDNFVDREHSYGFLRYPARKDELPIIVSQGDNWRRMRKILSKSFNAVHVRKMSPIIERSCDSLVSKLSDHVDTGKSVDVWKLFGIYTMDVVLATSFGYHINLINGEVDELNEVFQTVLRFTRENSFRNTKILYCKRDLAGQVNFPFLRGYLRNKAEKTPSGASILFSEAKVEGFVKQRLENADSVDKQHPDIFQLLLDARADSDDEDESTESGVTDIYAKKLTNMEVIRTSTAFIAAGYETTSSALGYVSYLLATNPAKQDQLYQEISDFYDKKPDASLYEAGQSLSYAEMAIQEAMRMYPPVPFINRHTEKTININGHVFPEGSTVTMPLFVIHHSPEIWPEPSVFRPERFTKEEKAKRHPMAHLPFGWGPRSCIASKLGLFEAKMALIAVMKEYKFVEAPDTEKPLKIKVGLTSAPTNKIFLEVRRR